MVIGERSIGAFTNHLSLITNHISSCLFLPHQLTIAIAYRLLTIGYSSSGMNRSQIRLIGLITLVLGLAIAEGIYWFGEKASSQQSDDLANSIQLENQRKADREIEIGFGKVYVILIHAEEWWAALPGYKQVAFVIAAATVVVAVTCFIFSAALRV
jgi:hypothetical protein